MNTEYCDFHAKIFFAVALYNTIFSFDSFFSDTQTGFDWLFQTEYDFTWNLYTLEFYNVSVW